MSLTERIAVDLINAMKNKEKIALEALRAAKTAFIMARSEKGAESVLTDDEEVKIIQKLVKQRMEAATIYEENNRPDLSGKEAAEAAVLEKYLPARLTAEELSSKLKEIIVRLGAKSQADMGKVMSVATKELAGKADGKEISAMVMQFLSQ